MEKEKIFGLTNSDDVIWYKFSPTDKTLKFLDSTFNISDFLFEEDPAKIYSYSFHTTLADLCFNKETDKFIAYFIFTKSEAHLILRKILKWKQFSDLIMQNFEFIQGKKLR